MLVILYVVLMLVSMVVGYPSGPHPSVCDSMIPGHGLRPQSNSPPYAISFPAGKTTYSDNEQIQVTLAGIGGQQFKGFMIQARPAANTYTTYGKIATYPPGTGNACSGNGTNKDAALTHTNATLKSSVTFTWTAPSGNVGNIVFVFTVVKSKAVFWVRGTSSVLSYRSSRDSPGVPAYKPKLSYLSSEESTDAVVKKDSRCGDSLGCFHDCQSNGNCKFLLTWRESGDYIVFTLTCSKPGNNVYCAVGFSKDKCMGDDSIVECVSRTEVSVYASYNYNMINFRLTEGKFGIVDVSGSHEDGILKCEFKRMKTAELDKGKGKRKKRTLDPSRTTFFDLNTDFCLLFAEGPAGAENIEQHLEAPKASKVKADFQSFMDLGSSTVAKTYVIVHGVLMMFAWLFFARLGMFIAWQFKSVWPRGMDWFGKSRWFILHRSIMVFVFLVTAVSFIIIFAYTERYSEITGTSFEMTHPILGIVTMCLVTINPIMAFFRPNPKDEKRQYFNFAHLGVGVASYVFAVLNIFSGFELKSSNVPSEAKILVGVYLVWVILIESISYLYDYKKKRDETLKKKSRESNKSDEASEGEEFEMKKKSHYKSRRRRSKQKVPAVTTRILWLHAIVMLGLVIAAAVLVAKGKPVLDLEGTEDAKPTGDHGDH